MCVASGRRCGFPEAEFLKHGSKGSAMRTAKVAFRAVEEKFVEIFSFSPVKKHTYKCKDPKTLKSFVPFFGNTEPAVSCGGL